MKKGCFFRSIIFIIITIGIIAYIYNKYGSEIIESGKVQIKEFVAEKIQKSIDSITESVEKDSLQKSLDKLIDDIDASNIKLNSDDFDKLRERFNELIDSNKIDFGNIEELRNLIKEYERTEKD